MLLDLNRTSQKSTAKNLLPLLTGISDPRQRFDVSESKASGLLVKLVPPKFNEG